jgi:hypothetical protein
MKCANPECNKELPKGKKYCNETCMKKVLEKKKEQKLRSYYLQAPNKGTEAKKTLQEQAIKSLKQYPKDLTAKQYARLLSWDLCVSQRTAYENYVQPMIEHYILILSGNGRYRLNPTLE